MNDQSDYDLYPLEDEEELDVEREALRSQIMEDFAGHTEEGIPALLKTYHQKYGSDLFWQLSSFDLAEMHQDYKTMAKILPLLREEDISPVVLQVHTARYFYTKGDFEGAMEELKLITESELEDNEEALMYLNMRGVVAFALEDYKEAVRCLEDMLLDIQDDQALAMAGFSYLHLGHVERAREYLLPFTTKDHTLGSMWLFEFAITFDQLELLKDSNFPCEIYKQIEDENFGFLSSKYPLEQLEELINRYSGFFLPILEKLAKRHPESELLAYFAGQAALMTLDISVARKWFRKVLTLPFGQDTWMNAAHQKYSKLFLKLICLDHLNYSPAVESRYCREFWIWADEHHEESSIIDLIRFCGMSDSSHNVIKRMLNEDQMPVPSNLMEAQRLHTGLLWYYFRVEDPLSALEQAQYLYKHHMIQDAFTLWIIAWVFFYCEEDSFMVNNNPNKYDSLEAFIIDQLIALEYDLRNEDDDHAFARLRNLESLHTAGDSEEWDLFDTFLPIVQINLEDRPVLQKYIRHLMKLFPGKRIS